MGKPRRIHLIQCYIRGWADNGRVFVQDDDLNTAPEPRAVASVGWRNAWWGADAGLSRAAESTLHRSENATRPSFGTSRRGGHCRRMTVPRGAVHGDSNRAYPAWLDRHIQRHQHGGDGDELKRRRWGAEVERPRWSVHARQLRVETLLKQVPRVASMLMSMQWSLVKFEEPMIASCDQPMIFVPRLPFGKGCRSRRCHHGVHASR